MALFAGAIKLIIMTAGPNGAGKTTFAREFLPNEMAGLEFLNANDIAADLCPEALESVTIRASRIMLELIAERVFGGKSFAIETTLSGKSYARSIPSDDCRCYCCDVTSSGSCPKAITGMRDTLRSG